jgi:hypothetical protein
MARQRLRDCGKCGSLKVLLVSGASRCLLCHNRRGREYYRNSAVRRRKQRESYVIRKYGLSIESLREMLFRQGSRCAICLKHWQDCAPAKQVLYEVVFLQYLYVDHDHKTGKVRGLLCNACNTAIGLFQEDPVRMTSALSYLRGADADAPRSSPRLTRKP